MVSVGTAVAAQARFRGRARFGAVFSVGCGTILGAMYRPKVACIDNAVQAQR